MDAIPDSHDYAQCNVVACPECILYQDSLDLAAQEDDEDWDAQWEALFNGFSAFEPHHDTREEERGER